MNALEPFYATFVLEPGLGLCAHFPVTRYLTTDHDTDNVVQLNNHLVSKRNPYK